MRHYLITGGAGFIGSNLSRRLLSVPGEARVTCVDNFDPFYPRSMKEFNLSTFRDNPDFKLIEADLAETSADNLNRMLPDGIDVIVHLAAKAGVRPSILDPLAYQRANVIGLQNLLDFARTRGIEQFVFSSSSSVYGINDHYPWKEDEQLMPISPYAMTKLAGEMLGHVYHKLYGIRFIALRFFTVYGPGQRPDLAIHKFTKAIIDGAPITVFGDGSTSRDYTFVNDTVQGIIGGINYKESGFEIINLGNNYTVSLSELISGIEKVTGKEAIIKRMPEQPGDVPRTFADISRAKKLLGYDPQTSIDEGLKLFYDWFTKNREKLEPKVRQ